MLFSLRRLNWLQVSTAEIRVLRGGYCLGDRKGGGVYRIVKVDIGGVIDGVGDIFQGDIGREYWRGILVEGLAGRLVGDWRGGWWGILAGDIGVGGILAGDIGGGNIGGGILAGDIGGGNIGGGYWRGDIVRANIGGILAGGGYWRGILVGGILAGDIGGGILSGRILEGYWRGGGPGPNVFNNINAF